MIQKKTLEDVLRSNRSLASSDGLESAEWDAVDPAKAGPAAPPRKPMTAMEALQIGLKTFNAPLSTLWWGAGQGLDALRGVEKEVRDYIGHPGSKERQDILNTETATAEDIDKIWDVTNLQEKQPGAGTFLKRSKILPAASLDAKFYGGVLGNVTGEELIDALGSAGASKALGGISKAGFGKLFNKPYTGSTRAVVAKELNPKTSIGNQILEGNSLWDRIPFVGSAKRIAMDTPVTETGVFQRAMNLGKKLRKAHSDLVDKIPADAGKNLSFDNVLNEAKATLDELRLIDNPVARQHADDLAQWILDFETKLSGKAVTFPKVLAEKRFTERALPAWAQNMAGKVKNTQPVQAVKKTAQNFGKLLKQMAEESGLGGELEDLNSRLAGQIVGTPKTMSRFLNETTNQTIMDSLSRTAQTVGGRLGYELSLPMHAYKGVPGAITAGGGKLWEGLRLDDKKPVKQKLIKQGDGLEPAEW
jgi:hypothetical protein